MLMTSLALLFYVCQQRKTFIKKKSQIYAIKATPHTPLFGNALSLSKYLPIHIQLSVGLRSVNMTYDEKVRKGNVSEKAANARVMTKIVPMK